MAGTGGDIRNREFTMEKLLIKGLYAIIDGDPQVNQPKDACAFQVVTGGGGLTDIPATPGTYTILRPDEIPLNCALDVTGLAAYVAGTVAWTGGTAGNVSISIQGTDGTVLATFTQAALTGSASNANPTTYSISAGSTLATGVLDANVRTIGPSLPKNVGLQVVVTNTPAAGSPVRFRFTGFFIPL